ncbi:MAG: FMN-binding negative transcriptional regulator [Pseudomonadota bacterium]
MYQPALFREDRVDVMHQLMRAHPFGLLTSIQAGRVNADHLPMVIHEDLAEKGIIRCHVAKGNPLWLDRAGSSEVLAVFQGPQAYVTPSWYPSKKVHGKVVPTWNYAVVHARGTLEFRDDHGWLMEHLSELTARHEGRRLKPWHVSDAPKDYMTRQFKGLVGVEIQVTELEGKWKVSQNKDAGDRKGVQEGLLREPDPSAAEVSELVGRLGR